MGVLSEELAALYSTMIEGKTSPLPPLAVQYADFAVWQREMLAGDGYQKQLAYWKDELKGAPPVLELPTDHPRQPVETFHGSVATLALSRELSEKLNHLSHDQGATLFMTLLAGFQLLLSRYSGQDDIVVGAPIANRVRREFEGLIGFFANTLALRTRLDGGVTFQELVSRVKETALGAYAHQDMPFEKLVEELRPERSLSHNPLVQVFFALQNAPMEAMRLKGLQLEAIETNTKTAKGDLYFSIVETPTGLRGRMEYNTDLFEAATIERMLGHYQALLEAAVASPTVPVSELPLLTGAERQQLLCGWNATDFDYPRDLCLHELFEQQAAKTPEAIACVFAEQQISYSELNQKANQLAHYLQKRGARPGERIGIFVERSLEMMIGLLGIQKSGAAYVPLDPSYPAERLRLTLDDAQVKVLVTQESLLASMPEHQAEVLCLDRDWPAIAQESSANAKSGATPEDLVYVIFTSGSTGRPKGVQVPHRAVVNLMTFMADELRMGANDVFPALASFAFDMCIPELYLALVSGGRVVIGEKHLAGNGEELSALLRKHGATIVHATPTTWNLLLECGFSGQGLKRVIGAEPVPRDLCTRLLEAYPSLYNFYGPTETTVWSAFHHFRSADEPLVVGKPLANTQIYILDKQLQPVPIGIPGEIHIAGDGVTCGYLNRPELTAEKFIRDPFSAKPGAKMYKTGDLGRYLMDGRIEFQGRIDNQVKVRGYRIELGEIETVLGKHPSVQECVVIAREDVQGDKRLVGYVVPVAGQTVNASELRTWVKERLPEYMVPVAVVSMERLPLSPNGKVDRKNLPAPEYRRPELEGEYEQARTPAEEVMAGIWAEVLKLDQVGVHDDFFALGGHSLLATQVVSRVRQAFQVELPLRALFEAPTVAGLTEKAETLQREKQGLQAPPIVRVDRRQKLPLSFAQQRLWFLDQLEPESPLYNVPHIVRMTGKLDIAVLDRTLNEIVRRHETLRTRFETVDDQPVQVIAEELKLELAVRDLSSLPAGDRVQEARRLAMEEVKRPFRLSAGPLLRPTLMKLDEQDHVLILNTHHIISDRWSLGVLSQELAAIYEAYLEGRPSPLPELAIQYPDYAVWQREYLSGPALDQQLQYWKQQLQGAPPVLDLPTDRPRPPIQTFNGAHKSQILPKALLSELKT
ncbi:MAG TPA: amino acid adenylation domain-containing protein, partial [Candidatus Acidoferrum sp.]